MADKIVASFTFTAETRDGAEGVQEDFTVEGVDARPDKMVAKMATTMLEDFARDDGPGCPCEFCRRRRAGAADAAATLRAAIDSGVSALAFLDPDAPARPN